ncbi:MAG: 4Fe-4S dicluster domain-containing protein, partial [Methanomicrobia archaeon]|nr:4Fe-4S dicluster domain-containing protein [Methanomicrobia archaeon]
IWKDQAEKCLACGTCTIVCPTCFCYDVNDEVDLNLTTGKRIRTWDGCLLRDFTKVGSGEIFRESLEERYRHRYNRKGRYLPDMLGFVACVGCGRCSTQCVPDIADPVDVMNMIAEVASQPVTESEATPLTAEDKIVSATVEEPLHVPRPATLKRVEKLTELETLFEIELDDGRPLGHQPGQFVEISVMGYGEAPISVSSAPSGNTFELIVRKVGDVTSKLHAMKPGEKVGIRGPFGKGFDMEALKRKNLLFIGGGIGIIPMRSPINYVLNNRQDFGEVTILYGCKKPCELLFKEEVAEWETRKDIQFMRSVDKCPEGESWDGETGVITCLIPKVKFDPKNTIAIVVGPPIMYRFVIRDLTNLGMPEENIIVSLERRMKCGVGKCGHCQINGVYVCKDGPVFNYKDVKDLPEAFT